jgi:hypothetical protein
MRAKIFFILVLILIFMNSLFVVIYAFEKQDTSVQEIFINSFNSIGKAVQGNIETKEDSKDNNEDIRDIYYSSSSGNSDDEDLDEQADKISLNNPSVEVLSSDNEFSIYSFQGFFNNESFDLYIDQAVEINESNQTNSDYYAEFLNEDGDLLKRFNFSVYNYPYSNNQEFSFICEVPVETKEIIFKHDLDILYEFTISDNTPEISNINIDNVGEDLYNITWQVQDIDGDNLIYEIYLVDEEGDYIIGADIQNNYFLFDSYFIGQGDYKIKIKSSDGFNFVEQESTYFNLAQKEPFIMIIGIENNDEIIKQDRIVTRAEGFDSEDGFLDSFSWYLDGEEISNEQEIDYHADLGEHSLRLEAEDSDGNIAEDSVNFSVLNKQSIFLDDCGNLDIEGAIYKVSEDIIMQETKDYCFEIRASNITLDCQGNMIQSKAINCIYSNFQNTVIKNCNIQSSEQGGLGGEFYKGIFFQGADDSYIFNNSLEDLDIGMMFRLTNRTELGGNTIKNINQKALSVLDGSVIRASFEDNDINGNILIRNATLKVF